MAIALLLGGLAVAAAEPLTISNEFVGIRVNPGPQEAGRFAVDTTGGDPSRTSDDDQVLIYGSRDPWTSYTTIWLDGRAVVFGGPTSRRAGRGAPVGEMVTPPRVEGETVVSAVRVGELEVSQELSLARSLTTRVRDAARIAYTVTNRGQAEHQVGLRVVLDTMLGSNDGAPLRAGEKAIATATQLTGDDIPDYWQAFDSLARPGVISQGTLRGPGLNPPDRLEMVDWGTLADHPWEFPFPTGADFTRQGEEEQDTAVALYWDPQPLRPGESRTYATLYGVGGVTLSPAKLSLGLTAPAEVEYQHDEVKPFLVMAYLENSGGFESRGTACALELPQGLRLVEGQAAVPFGLLRPGETRQASWRVAPTGEATGPLAIAVRATSENLEPNRVEREVTVVAAPELEVALAAPARLTVTAQNRYSPNPFEVTATVRNAGGQPARSLVVTLTATDGLKLAEETQATQVTERLDPGQERRFRWRVTALGMPTGELALMARATAAGAKPAEARQVVSVPWLTPEFRVYPADQTVPATTDDQPTLVPIAVKLAPAREFVGTQVAVTYDPAVLTPLYVSRGEAFVEGGRLLSPWSAGRMAAGRIEGIGGERREAPPVSLPEITLFTVVFMVRGPGESVVGLEPAGLLGPGGGEQRYRVESGRVGVRAAEEAR